MRCDHGDRFPTRQGTRDWQNLFAFERFCRTTPTGKAVNISKGGPVFSKLLRLDRTDPLSFGPKFWSNGSRPLYRGSFHIFLGTENRLLYRGLRYMEVHYIVVPQVWVWVKFVSSFCGRLVKVKEVWNVFSVGSLENFIGARSIFETFLGQRLCWRAEEPGTRMKAQASCSNKHSEKDEEEVIQWFSSFWGKVLFAVLSEGLFMKGLEPGSR